MTESGPVLSTGCGGGVLSSKPQSGRTDFYPVCDVCWSGGNRRVLWAAGRRRKTQLRLAGVACFLGESKTPPLLLDGRPADQERQQAWQARRAHLNLRDSASFKKMPVLASAQEALLQTIETLQCSLNPKRCLALQGSQPTHIQIRSIGLSPECPCACVTFLKPLPTRTTASTRPMHILSLCC